MSHIASPKGLKAPLSYVQDWFTPQANDRDEAFRERMIRIIVFILLTANVLLLIVELFIYRNPWGLLSYPTSHIATGLLLVGAAYTVARQRLEISGQLLTLGGHVGIVLLTLVGLQDNVTVAVLYNQMGYIFVPILAAIILPKKNIIPFTLLSVTTLAIMQFIYPADEMNLVDFVPTAQAISVIIIIGLEGTLLYFFRSEFDARLQVVSESLEQERVAKLEAEEARQQAEKADRAKTQFLASMSHELRTPLNAIIGYSEAMLGGMVGDFADKQRKYLSYIQINGRSLLELINGILDLSKIEAETMTIHIEPVPIQELFERTTNRLSLLAEDKSIALQLEFAENMPELIMTDQQKLEQIYVNLLGNAIKFTEAGQVTVTIEPAGKTEWQFIVQDTGIGISEQHLQDIFARFTQVDASPTRRFEGTGIGLAVVKEFTDMLKGSIDVQSELGTGTSFILRFPRNPQKTDAEPIPSASISTSV